MSKIYKQINKLREIDNTFEVITAEDFINKEIKIIKQISKNKGHTIFPKNSLNDFSTNELQEIANSKGYDFLPYNEYLEKYKEDETDDYKSFSSNESYILCKKH